MAIRVDKLNISIKVADQAEQTRINETREFILKSLDGLESYVQSYIDIYDTFWHIKKNEVGTVEFRDGLWAYLCTHDKGFDINSYMAISTDKYGRWGVQISRSGFALEADQDGHYLVSDNPDYDCNGNDKNVFRGKILAKNYIESHPDMSLEWLTKISASLEIFRDMFHCYTDGFWDLVDNYKVFKNK